MSRIAVIGAGAWGTALAIVLGHNGGHAVTLWAHEADVFDTMILRHENTAYLPGCQIPENVAPTNDLAVALKNAEFVLSVMPSHHCRGVFKQMAPFLNSKMRFVSATKGIENTSLLRMSQVIGETVFLESGFTPKVSVLSGPSFARETAKGDPTAITVASFDEDLRNSVQQNFSGPTFRIYTSDDVIGVEMGGALKNVIAIAAGIVEGLGLGHNTAAALITRGLAEITRLAEACGARRETMAGLAGMGDLVLTCTGGLSRNRTVGVHLGQGKKLPEIIAGMHGMVAEGVLTTNAVVGLAHKHGIEMPITDQMFAILNDGKQPKDAIRDLMVRPGKSES
jgi:glycerol-3-phosphate dehydrogenase (NAD(P)+)